MKVTVEDVGKLEPGGKLPVGPGLHIRRNKNDTITVWGRIKREGKSVDVKAGVADWPVTSQRLLLRLIEEATATRVEERRRKPTSKPLAAPTGALAPTATTADVWGHLLNSIKTSGKWTDRNTAVNAQRIKKWAEPSAIWKIPVSSVTPLQIADVLLRISASPDQQRKVRGLLSLIFDLATGAGLIVSSPVPGAAAMLRATTKATAKKHFPTVLDADHLRRIYISIGSLSGSVYTRAAMQLQALTVLRTGEVVTLEWADVDLNEARIVIPRARMKSKDVGRPDHVVPLSRPAIALLQSLPRKNQYVFPGRGGEGHLDENTPSKMMRVDLKMADVFVPHSWRSSFRTLATRATDETGRPLFSSEWLETCLDHVSGEELAGAYQRGGHVEGARRSIEWWAMLLTGAAL